MEWIMQAVAMVGMVGSFIHLYRIYRKNGSIFFQYEE